MNDLKFVILNPPERKRIYQFPTHRLVLSNVTKIEIRDSGKHRLECDQGKIWVNAGWLWIELDVDEWTF
jgi:hypothetical protein